MSYEELVRLAPPPGERFWTGTEDGWREIEEALGTPLPEDYKQVVSGYGTGVFGGYISFYNPFDPRFDMAETVPSLLQLLGEVQSAGPEFTPPYPLHPAPGGLLPWGHDENAGNQFWLTRGDPDEWTVVICDSHFSENYYVFEKSVTGFLVDWLTGRIVVPFYPPDIDPTTAPRFRATKTV